jgi:hypothetical protein
VWSCQTLARTSSDPLGGKITRVRGYFYLPWRMASMHPPRAGLRHGLLHGRRNLILRSVESSRSPRVTHSFHYAGTPHKCLYGAAPYKSPKIAENRVTCGGRWVCGLAARAADKYRQKSLNCRKKRRLRRISEVQPDLRGSAGPPRVTHRSTNYKIKLHRPCARGKRAGTRAAMVAEVSCNLTPRPPSQVVDNLLH